MEPCQGLAMGLATLWWQKRPIECKGYEQGRQILDACVKAMHVRTMNVLRTPGGAIHIFTTAIHHYIGSDPGSLPGWVHSRSVSSWRRCNPSDKEDTQGIVSLLGGPSRWAFWIEDRFYFHALFITRVCPSPGLKRIEIIIILVSDRFLVSIYKRTLSQACSLLRG